VARALLVQWAATSEKRTAQSPLDHCRDFSRAILTPTDPAVHLAMLDALVRAGVLKRSTQRGTLISSGSILELDRGGKVHERFASDWREVAP